jgi:hypothetical protein
VCSSDLINNSCSQTINKTAITTTPGTSVNDSSKNVNDFHNQHNASAQYDSNDIDVQPMYGGNLKKFNIKFLNKLYSVNSNNEINAIKEITYNKIFKKDNLLEIKDQNTNNYNLYVVRKKDKKNSLCKIKKLDF